MLSTALRSLSPSSPCASSTTFVDLTNLCNATSTCEIVGSSKPNCFFNLSITLIISSGPFPDLMSSSIIFPNDTSPPGPSTGILLSISRYSPNTCSSSFNGLYTSCRASFHDSIYKRLPNFSPNFCVSKSLIGTFSFVNAVVSSCMISLSSGTDFSIAKLALIISCRRSLSVTFSFTTLKYDDFNALSKNNHLTNCLSVFSSLGTGTSVPNISFASCGYNITYNISAVVACIPLDLRCLCKVSK